MPEPPSKQSPGEPIDWVRFDNLVDLSMEDLLSGAECDELKQILENSDEARTRYVDAVALGELLEIECQSRSQLYELLPFPSQPITEVQRKDLWIEKSARRTLSRVGWMTTGSAVTMCGAFIAIGLGLIGPPEWKSSDWIPDAVETPIAFVGALEKGVWHESVSKRVREEGEILKGEPIRLESGFATINLKNGVRFVLEGPAEISLSSPVLAEFTTGQAVMTVPQHIVGFRVVKNSESRPARPEVMLAVARSPAEIGFGRTKRRIQDSRFGSFTATPFKGSFRIIDLRNSNEETGTSLRINETWSRSQIGKSLAATATGIVQTPDSRYLYTRDLASHRDPFPVRRMQGEASSEDPVTSKSGSIGTGQGFSHDITDSIQFLGAGRYSLLFEHVAGPPIVISGVQIASGTEQIAWDNHPGSLTRTWSAEPLYKFVIDDPPQPESRYRIDISAHSNAAGTGRYNAYLFRNIAARRNNFLGTWTNGSDESVGETFQVLPCGSFEVPEKSGYTSFTGKAFYFRDGSLFVIDKKNRITDELRMMGADMMRSVRHGARIFFRQGSLGQESPVVSIPQSSVAE